MTALSQIYIFVAARICFFWEAERDGHIHILFTGAIIYRFTIVDNIQRQTEGNGVRHAVKGLSQTHARAKTVFCFIFLFWGINLCVSTDSSANISFFLLFFLNIWIFKFNSMYLELGTYDSHKIIKWNHLKVVPRVYINANRDSNAHLSRPPIFFVAFPFKQFCYLYYHTHSSLRLWPMTASFV